MKRYFPFAFGPLLRLSIVLTLLAALSVGRAKAQGWYNSNWQYRKAIVIDKSKVGSGTLTDFPLLISITDAELQSNARSNGNDILFTASDGTTKLDHEIERYQSSSGELEAWVRLPSLSNAANTVIYMYYGYSSASNQQNATGVWSSSFEGVYHLDANYSDATSNGRNATNHSTSSTTGKISRGRNLSSTSRYISISGLMGDPASITLSGWADLSSYGSGGSEFISLGDYCAIRMTSSGATGFFYNGSNWTSASGGTDYSGDWHYLCYTFESGGSSQVLYVDGVQVASTSSSSSISYNGLGYQTYIGRHGNGSSSFAFRGKVDEIRVASTARSAGWIQTEYNNQNDPSSFYILGNCESQPPTVTSPVAYCQNATATQLTASGSGLIWSSGSITGSCGGTSTLSTSTWVSSSSSNQKTLFSTLANNVVITSVDYYIPAWQSVSGMQLAIFNSSGSAVALSTTVTTLSASSSSVKVTNDFHAVLPSSGSYSIGVYSGSGNIGGDVPSFPINESTGTLRVTGKSSSYRCYNNIQFDAGAGTTAPTPSTSAPGSTNYTVYQSVGGCPSPYATIQVDVTGSVGTPVFALGSSSSRCKSAASVTYTATAANSTGISYSLDASSLAAGNSINASTGQVNYVASWTGTSTITATASGCNGPTTANHTVTTSAIPVSATATPTCVGGSSGTLTISASGGVSPYNYSLNSGSYQSSNVFSGLAAGSYSIDVTSSDGCLGSTTTSVAPYDTSSDSQTTTGSDTWIGHVYDGAAFNSYYGHFTEAETFNESFGGSTNCFKVYSGSDSAYIYTEYFSVKYRMNSTRRGLYIVDLGSDDGSRLTIDGTMVYSNWVPQAFSIKPRVLIPLTGTSSLLYEFFENSGGNQVAFQNLTLLIADTFNTNITQSICLGNTGLPISGDSLGSLPGGISLSGTGYQWSYSTTPGGSRTNISGATAATFTPSTLTAPFNAAGTYYLYRTVSLTSSNNVSPSSFTASVVSDSAVVIVSSPPSATINYPGSPYNSYGGTATVVLTGTSGGTFSAAAGLSINAGTGAINLGASTPGTYVVSYTVAASGGCSIFITTDTVTIVHPYQFRSVTSGAWTNASTWEISGDGGATWASSSTTPTSNTDTVTISSGDNVSVAVNIQPSLLHVAANAILSPDSTIVISGNGTLDGSGTVQATRQGSDFSTQYTIQHIDLSALTVDYAAAGAQSISALSYFGLRVSNTAATVSAGGNFSVSDTLEVAGGSVLNGGSYTIGGTGVLSGEGTVLVTATGNSSGDFSAQYSIATKDLKKLMVSFAGATQQWIDGMSIPRLSIDNSAGARLSGNVTVDSVLRLNTGLLLLYTNHLTMGDAAIVTGNPSATSMVVTNGSGTMRKLMSNLGSFSFPVGDNTGTAEYSPASITRTTGGYAAGAYVSVQVVNAKHPSNHSISNYLNRYWVVGNSGISGNVTGSFQYVPADVSGAEASMYGGRYTASGSTQWTTLSAANTASHILAAPAFAPDAVYTGTDRSCGVYNYRSVISGNWDDVSSWEASVDKGTTWFAAGSYPGTSNDTVLIQTGTTINGTINASPKMMTIDGGGILSPDASVVYSGSGSLSGSGTIEVTRISGSNQFTTQYAMASTDVTSMTVDYVGAASQDVSATTYGVLSISGTGTKALQTGFAQTNNLVIGASNTFKVTATLKIAGAISNSGTFSTADATIEMNGTSAQSIPAGTFGAHEIENLIIDNSAGVSLADTTHLTGTLKVTNGTFASNGLLTLMSDNSGTALIDGAGSGSVTGLVTMQRYLPSGFGYRYISSPFQAAHVSELNDDISLTDSFATLYGYDENVNHAGWIKYTDTSYTLQTMAGYAANFGASTTARTIDIRGQVNNGPLSINLYNHNQTYTLGFNLVGNPYPSPIDWDASGGWTKTNIDDAIYYFNNGVTDRYQGAYSSYVNGVSSDGVANNVIASMQGFFVHVSNGTYPVSGTLSMTNAVRLTNLSPVYHKQLGVSVSLARISAGFADVDSFSDPTVVYFDGAAQEGFERDKDAVKLWNTDARVPSLYSLCDGKQLAINAQPYQLDDRRAIPLGLHLERDGEVVFRRCDFKELPAGLHVFFADAASGVIQNLEQEPEYRVQLQKGDFNNRFYLLFSREAHPEIPGQEQLITFMQGHNLVLDMHENEGSLVVVNATGQTVIRQQLQGKGRHEISFAAAPGIYVVSLRTDAGVKSRKVLVSGN